MKILKLHIKTDSTAIFETLAAFTQEKIIQNEYEKHLSYIESLGIMEIKNSRVNKSLSFFDYKFTLKEDLTLDVLFDKEKGLFFMYNLQEEINSTLLYSEEQHIKLSAFQPCILVIHEKECLRFHFKKEVEYSFFTIQMVDIGYLKEKYKASNFFLNPYREFFTFLNTEENNIHNGSNNLRIADYIQQLHNISVEGMSSQLFMEGILYIILALKIQQFSEDKTSKMERVDKLTQKDCMEVKRISDIILLNPEKAFSIDYLCVESTLSPFKIQEGFKKMHGRTVVDFIRNVRVDKAENLLTTTDLNISEIVYSIGFTSRSYFAKIFKEKYNCSPKTYQNNKRNLAVTA